MDKAKFISLSVSLIIIAVVSFIFLLEEATACTGLASTTLERSNTAIAKARLEKRIGSSNRILASILDDFSLGEGDAREVTLTRGESYTFAAAGCPRMGRIGIYIKDSRGRIIRQTSGYSPSICFITPRSGRYTVEVKALSLVEGNTWGSIAADLIKDGCN